jgi:hypothetical protein
MSVSVESPDLIDELLGSFLEGREEENPESPLEWADLFTRQPRSVLKEVPEFRVLPSQWIEFAIQIYLKDVHQYQPFPFTNRRYLKEVIDSPSKAIIFLFGRQAEKSTSLGNICLTHCCLIPAVHILYVSPTAPQTKIFSNDRIATPIEISPKVKRFTSRHLPMNIFEKTFIKQSKIILRYCYYTADRIRGIAADVLMIDEMQDIITDNVPIMEETLSHSPLRKRYYAGTPKAAEGSLGAYWRLSNQKEWAIPCERHSPYHWNILDERNIGLKGLICNRCGAPLYPYHPEAQWVTTVEGKMEFDGYRVPQVMVPIHQGEEEWQILLQKREKYGPAQFDNEVLAIFSEAGDKPITREELKACCNPDLKIEDPGQMERRERWAISYPVFAGIDWGTGTQSYTVLVLGSYFGTDRFKVFFFKRYVGREADPLYQIRDITRILAKYKVTIAGVDYGFGYVQNAKIAQDLAGSCEVARCYYSSNPKHKISMAPGVNRFTLHRSEMMSNLFNIMKTQKIEFPNWAEFKSYGEDILNIFTTYNENLRMIQYDHPPTSPDDAFHAILYAFVASFIEHPREDLLGLPQIPIADY